MDLSVLYDQTLITGYIDKFFYLPAFSDVAHFMIGIIFTFGVFSGLFKLLKVV